MLADYIKHGIENLCTDADVRYLITAASLRKHGFLTKVYTMRLPFTVNMDTFPLASYLGDIEVDSSVYLWAVKGDVGGFIEKIKCLRLQLQWMELSTRTTRSLVIGMPNNIKIVIMRVDKVGWTAPTPSDPKGVRFTFVNDPVDFATLFTYNGQGKCKIVEFWSKEKSSIEKYKGQIESWAKQIGWEVRDKTDDPPYKYKYHAYTLHVYKHGCDVGTKTGGC